MLWLKIFEKLKWFKDGVYFMEILSCKYYSWNFLHNKKCHVTLQNVSNQRISFIMNYKKNNFQYYLAQKVRNLQNALTNTGNH